MLGADVTTKNVGEKTEICNRYTFVTSRDRIDFRSTTNRCLAWFSRGTNSALVDARHAAVCDCCVDHISG